MIEAKRLAPYVYAARKSNPDMSITERMRYFANQIFNGTNYNNNNNADNNRNKKLNLSSLLYNLWFIR